RPEPGAAGGLARPDREVYHPRPQRHEPRIAGRREARRSDPGPVAWASLRRPGWRPAAQSHRQPPGPAGGRFAAMIDRYSTPEMKALWSESERYRVWLDVELAATAAFEELVEVPRGTA